MEYTIHFQNYPTPPGASHGIKALLDRIGPSDVIVLRGNPSGYEDDIQSIKNAGIRIDDKTDAC